jgi:hypothetical protein
MTIQQRSGQGNHCGCSLCKPHKNGFDAKWGKGSKPQFQPRYLARRQTHEEIISGVLDYLADKARVREEKRHMRDVLKRWRAQQHEVPVYSKRDGYLKTVYTNRPVRI